MSDKTEQVFIPDALWKIVKDFLFTPPPWLLCKIAKTPRGTLGRTIQNPGEFLCKCVCNSNGSFTFHYACRRHFALNSPMKLTLARKEMFYRAREVVPLDRVGTKNLRIQIAKHLTKKDLMRMLCSKRNKHEIGEEVLTLCKIDF
jgi:hypothetical protein